MVTGSVSNLVYAPQGMTDKAQQVFTDADLNVICGSNGVTLTFAPTVEWVRLKPPQTKAAIVASPATGKNHLTNLATGVKLFDLSHIPKELLESIRSTSEIAVLLCLQLMRVVNVSRGKDQPGERIQRKRYYQTHAEGRVARHIFEVMRAMQAIETAKKSEADIIFVTDRYEGKAVVDLSFMLDVKQGVYIINPARTELVDPYALLKKVWNVAGYAEDITTPWKKSTQATLARHTKTYFTNHIGGYAKESLEEVETALAEVVVKHLKGGA